MEQGVTIDRVRFERAQLVFEGSAARRPEPYLQSDADAGVQIAPSFLQWQDGAFSVFFDMITGNAGNLLPAGIWRLCCGQDAIHTPDGCDVQRDYSGGDVTYRVCAAARPGGVPELYVESARSRRLGPKRAAFSVLRAGMRLAFAASRRFSRGCRRRVLFTSASRDSLTGNLRDIYDRMCARGLDQQYELRFALCDCRTMARKLFFYLRLPFLLGASGYILLDDYHPALYQFHYPADVEIIQLWHACGAFKTVGYSRAGRPGAPDIAGVSHKCYTKAIVSGSGVRRYYAEAFGIPLSRVYATGMPRTDQFFDPSHKRESIARFFDRFPALTGRRILLFAPTFRGDGAGSAYYPYECIDFAALAGYCRETGAAAVFKMHPFVREPVPIPPEYADVLADASDLREVNDILFAADVLITDYSSVIYEYSLLGRPMLFYTFDLAEYTASRDFYEPFESFVPGKITRTFEELLDALRKGSFAPSRAEAFRERNFDAADGHATDRVIDLVFGTQSTPQS